MKDNAVCWTAPGAGTGTDRGAQVRAGRVSVGCCPPERWSETYATADIVEYDGKPRMKLGREFRLRQQGAKTAE